MTGRLAGVEHVEHTEQDLAMVVVTFDVRAAPTGLDDGDEDDDGGDDRDSTGGSDPAGGAAGEALRRAARPRIRRS